MKCDRCKFKKYTDYGPNICTHDANAEIKVIEINGSSRIIYGTCYDVYENCTHFSESFFCRIGTYFTNKKLAKLKLKYPEKFI